MELASLQDLMVMTLQDLHSAETQWLMAAPDLMKAVSSDPLLDSMMKHMEATGQQVKRLEQALARFGEVPGERHSKTAQVLIEEARQIAQAQGDPDVKDAALLFAQQKFEHSEIAAYGTAVTFAKLLGDQEAARLLAQTLDEEEKTDKALSQLAKSRINKDADDAAPSA